MKTNLFDYCFASRFRALREKKNEKEIVIAGELGLRQQHVSLLLCGKMHFTEEIISTICWYYKIAVPEFKKLSYSNEVKTFVEQLKMDAGESFNDRDSKIKILELSKHHFRKENRRLVAENSNLKWKLEKKHHAENILSKKIKTGIYVAI